MKRWIQFYNSFTNYFISVYLVIFVVGLINPKWIPIWSSSIPIAARLQVLIFCIIFIILLDVIFRPIDRFVVSKVLVKADKLLDQDQKEDAMWFYSIFLFNFFGAIQPARRKTLVETTVEWLIQQGNTEKALELVKKAERLKVPGLEELRQKLEKLTKPKKEKPKRTTPKRATPKRVASTRAIPTRAAPAWENIGWAEDVVFGLVPGKSVISFEDIGRMMKSGDVKSLSRAFQRAGNWDTRETIAVSLRNMISQGFKFDRTEMIATLNTMKQVCLAEVGGGSYRINCIQTAEDMLKKLQKKE